MQRLIVLIPDLFFSVKVADTARALGYAVHEVKDAAALVCAVREGAAAIVLDTQERSNWQHAVRELKADPATIGTPILAFGSHVDVETQRAAVAAGCDRIVTRGKLANEIPDLLRQLTETPRHQAM